LEARTNPIELWSNKVIQQKIDYVHHNPVEEGLVYKGRKIMFIVVLLIIQVKKD
jgi:hypothetical protein